MSTHLKPYYLSATGHLPAKFPHDQWNEAVRWHGDTKLAATIQNEAELADAKIILSKLEKVVVEAESRHGVVVWSSTQNCPTTIPADSYPLQLIVLPGEEIQRPLPETLHGYDIKLRLAGRSFLQFSGTDQPTKFLFQ